MWLVPDLYAVTGQPNRGWSRFRLASHAGPMRGVCHRARVCNLVGLNVKCTVISSGRRREYDLPFGFLRLHKNERL